MTETTPETAAPAPETHHFQAEVESVLRLVIDSLYSNRDVFLRELLSNASDALDKLRFAALTDASLLPEGETLQIHLTPDAAAGTLTIADNGIGMTKDELASHLGTIAKSGTRELIKELASQGKKDGPGLIGQFGVGFYSAFLVAERVDVTSRKAGSREAWTWSSDGRGSFTLAPASRPQQGTSVVLHLKADAKDELRQYQLEQLVKKYSDYLHFPIQLKVDREKTDEPAWRTINRGSALWQRGASEIKKEDLDELYKHVAHDFAPPLAAKHFKIEGTTEFAGVLFVPSRAPFDLFDPDAKRGLRLYVKRVFIFDEAEALLPRWLRFLRGVIDSEDLPLNVSRELLQDSRVVRIIKQQVTSKALEMLTALAKDRPDDYATFWKTFGAVLKEALAMGQAEGDLKKKVLPLLRYESSTRPGLVSLADAKAALAEGQPGIYFAVGQSRRQLETSPHLEGLKAKGYEVLFMTDPVDHWVMGQGEGLEEYEGTKLLNVASAELDLGKKEEAPAEGDLSSLRDAIRLQLQDRLAEVRLGERLVDSPACLVMPEGGISPHLERLVRAAQPELAMPQQKRILEINPKHPLVKALEAAREKGAPELPDLLTLLYEQALIAEGSQVEDPAALAKRIHQLMLKAVG